MKYISAVLLSFLIAVCVAAAQDAKCLPLRRITQETLAFKGGEKMTFKIHYKVAFINADIASAVISLDSTELNGRPAYASRVYARTYPFYDNFFRLREDFRSWFSVEDLRPEKFLRESHEGKYTARNDYKFVWNAGEPHISAEIETSRKPKYSKEIPLDGCTFDPMTLFFTARNMDMTKVKENEPYPMTFAVADDVYTIYFVYKGKERRSVDGIGNVNAMRFEVQVLDGDVFTGDSDMVMWFSDDDNRILLGFNAPLKLGLVHGRLTAIEGLKHELNVTSTK